MKPPLPSRYLLAVVLCLVTTLIALPLRQALDSANTDMLFLLTVFICAISLGRGPSVLAAFLGVVLFDFFFVPPYYSLQVADAQYLVTFAVMLAVGLITAHLVAALAESTAQAQAGELETRELYRLACALGAALTPDQVIDELRRFLAGRSCDALLLLPAADGAFASHGPRRPSPLELGFARSARDRGTAVEARTLAGPGMATLYLPLHAGDTTGGVLAIETPAPARRDPPPRALLDAVASLAAIAAERLRCAELAQQSELRASHERLRTSILAALSHDLRTPLTGLVGLADTLAEDSAALSPGARETARRLRDQADAMHRMLSNLMAMAHIKAGGAPNREWQPVEEIVGTSTRLLADRLTGRPLHIALPPDLPLVNFDAVLIERVLCNLLDNAVKHSPPGSAIALAAAVTDDHLEVAVSSQGAGFPPALLGRPFELFAGGRDRGGMGLAICQAILDAHQGRLRAENLEEGARVSFCLPLGTPPEVGDEDAP